MAWLVAFIAYSWFHFGHALPSYFLASRLNFHSFWIALAANLISPSRGLLVFVPATIFIIANHGTSPVENGNQARLDRQTQGQKKCLAFIGRALYSNIKKYKIGPETITQN